jgi:hypothetical protein
MIKYILFLLSVLSFNLLNAQTFKPFKVIVTAGYAILSGHYIKGGIATYLDGLYTINDKVSIGISVGSAGIGPAKKDAFYLNEKFLGNAVMFTATGTYHFNTNRNRPFISLASGLGMVDVYTVKNINFDVNSIQNFLSKNRVDKLIISSGAGIERDHFRLVAEYTYFGKAEDISSNFLTLKAGVFIGGGEGKKKVISNPSILGYRIHHL